MPVRLSGSIEEADLPPLDEQPNSHNGEKESLTSAKFETTRRSDTLDRRKLEKVFESPSPNGSGNAQTCAPHSPPRYAAAVVTIANSP